VKIASLFLAAVLQVLPICRVAVVSQATAPSAWVLVMTWVAGAVALLGSYDAVSGASAGVSGLVKYSGSTPVGTPTFDVAEPMGQAFRYRITVSNPGTDFAKNYFNCIPLPPGLTINTNLGGSGYISGTPKAAGAYAVTLVAGNLDYPTPATAQAMITIYLPNAPPVIDTQPHDQSVLVGSNAIFQAEVSGTPPLSFQWRRSGTNVPEATTPALAFTDVQPDDAGSYQLFVSNAYGSITSAIARLTVREPFLVQLLLGGPTVRNGSFQFQVTGPIHTNYVVWRSGDLQAWTPISTNWVIDGLLQVNDPTVAMDERRFYRASVAP
jgi:uncharacterized repeat protein (TIGR01451 family)